MAEDIIKEAGAGGMMLDAHERIGMKKIDHMMYRMMCDVPRHVMATYAVNVHLGGFLLPWFEKESEYTIWQNSVSRFSMVPSPTNTSIYAYVRHVIVDMDASDKWLQNELVKMAIQNTDARCVLMVRARSFNPDRESTRLLFDGENNNYQICISQEGSSSCVAQALGHSDEPDDLTIVEHLKDLFVDDYFSHASNGVLAIINVDNRETLSVSFTMQQAMV